MSTNTYLAVFTGSKSSPRRKAWDAMTDDQRRAKEKEGIAAWGAWMAKNNAVLVEGGGPLGKTKRVSADGIGDVSNDIGAFVMVRAASPEEAAKLFEDHPHFTIPRRQHRCHAGYEAARVLVALLRQPPIIARN